MLQWISYLMVYLGSAIMIYNIYGFISFARFIKRLHSWQQKNTILYFPIALLVMFFLGYLSVGIFGSPDMIVAGILFGGTPVSPETIWAMKHNSSRFCSDCWTMPSSLRMCLA